jgi:endogenous inhibitor of DNA gyrase (YacG/DUF329 family)
MVCPLCKAPAQREKNTWRPFCSERCYMTDLGNWAGEQYRIPGPRVTVESELKKEDLD